MNANEFRRIALGFPDTIESAHMNHPDFRVSGKIFATLFPDEKRGVVMLTPDQQEEWAKSAPKAFAPANGAWGRNGCTQVVLEEVSITVVRKVIQSAWLNKAPKKLARKFEGLKCQ